LFEDFGPKYTCNLILLKHALSQLTNICVSYDLAI
jgi:hypothetical protein